MSKARILVVEDEVIIAMEIKNNLQSNGYEVTSVVGSGDDAIKKAEEDKPDLILMDIRIKGDRDGIEIAEYIRLNLGIPVIFSTAYLDEQRIERAKITMPFGYLLKPIQSRDLKVTVEMALYVAKVDEQRKIAEEQIKSHVLFLDRIMEQSPFSMWISDKEGTVIKTNKVLREALNLEDEQIVGNYNVQEDINLVEQGVMQQVKAVFEQHIPAKFIVPWVGEKAGKAEFHGAKDLWIDVSMFPILSEKGELLNVVCQWLDITEQKQIADKLSQNEKKYYALFENSPDGVFLTDNNARFIEVNNSACKMTGYSSDELLQLSIPDISSQNTEVLKQDIKIIQNALGTGKGEGIIHLKHKKGHIIKVTFKSVMIDEFTIMSILDKIDEAQ